MSVPLVLLAWLDHLDVELRELVL
eukprot:SAG22_NODE_12487_length_441_cov_0.751462_1_plen_23_part_10